MWWFTLLNACTDPCLREPEAFASIPVVGTSEDQARIEADLGVWAQLTWFTRPRICSVEVVADQGLEGDVGGRYRENGARINIEQGEGSSALSHCLGHATDLSFPGGPFSDRWAEPVDWAWDFVKRTERLPYLFEHGPLGLALKSDPVVRDCLPVDAVAELDEVMQEIVQPDADIVWDDMSPTVIIEFPPQDVLLNLDTYEQGLVVAVLSPGYTPNNFLLPALGGNQAWRGDHYDTVQPPKFHVPAMPGMWSQVSTADGHGAGAVNVNRIGKLWTVAFVVVDPAQNAGRAVYLSCGLQTPSFWPRFYVDRDGLWVAEIRGATLALRLLEPTPGADTTPRRWRVPDVHPWLPEVVTLEPVPG